MKTVYEHMLLHDSIKKISDKIGQEAIMRHAILLCNRANMPVVAYSHAYYELMNLDMLDFIVERDSKMEDYCVDNGFHLNTQGNRILVDRFNLDPCIDTKISSVVHLEITQRCRKRHVLCGIPMKMAVWITNGLTTASSVYKTVNVSLHLNLYPN